MRALRLSLFVYLLCASGALAQSDGQASKVTMPTFSASELLTWKEKEFSGHTSYGLTEIGGQKVLKAESNNSASGLFLKIEVDLAKFPYLNWSWMIEKQINPGDEKSKSGDDYAARIYVIIDGGFLPWRTKALNYVWAKEVERGEIWDNAFAGKNAQMMALRSGKDKTETWYYEKRNIFEDLKMAFGSEFKKIDGLAIMTDTDNSKGQALSFYGDIYFSTK